MLLVQKLVEDARLPVRGSELAAGYDLYASENSVIHAKSRSTVATGIAIRVPHGTYGRIAPRSGLAVKKGIDIGAGVIDEDYTGHVMVVVFNHGDDDFEVQQGDRIAQLILEKIETPEVQEVDTLETTTRGRGGFGSTGRA
jgi:dUTP pyrophosphatase